MPSDSSCCSRLKTIAGLVCARRPRLVLPFSPLLPPWSITTSLSMLPSGAETAPKTLDDAWMIAGSFSRIVCRRAASLNSFHASALRRMAAASAVPCASIAFACARPMASIFAASARPSASTAAARPTPSLRSFSCSASAIAIMAERRPSASRIADCFAASARVTAACRSASAGLMTVASSSFCRRSTSCSWTAIISCVRLFSTRTSSATTPCRAVASDSGPACWARAFCVSISAWYCAWRIMKSLDDSAISASA